MPASESGGAVALTILRFVQGVGVGGEWGGSVLLSMEWARTDHSRGFIASWPQFGVPCGLFLANLAVLAFSQMSGDQFLAWGWRVPFLLNLVLVGVGLYIRLGVLETPVFNKLLAERKIERTPILEAIKRHPKEIVLSAFARMAEQAPFYIFTAFIFSYGTGTLHVSRDFLLTAVLAASIVSLFSIPFFGHLSDRMGRKNMYMIGAIATGIFGFIYFGLVNTGIEAVIFVAIVLSLIPHDMMYGPQAALIAESFTGRLRYSGASLGYQLASVIATSSRTRRACGHLGQRRRFRHLDQNFLDRVFGPGVVDVVAVGDAVRRLDEHHAAGFQRLIHVLGDGDTFVPQHVRQVVVMPLGVVRIRADEKRRSVVGDPGRELVELAVDRIQ
jgi:MFS family permease